MSPSLSLAAARQSAIMIPGLCSVAVTVTATWDIRDTYRTVAASRRAGRPGSGNSNMANTVTELRLAKT